MKSSDLLELLKEFYRDKLALREQHFAGAQSVTGYEFNNTYQYVIAREDVQLTWLHDAIADLGGQVADVREAHDPGVAGVTAGKMRRERKAQNDVFQADRDAARRFVEKWRPRLEAVPNARHRSMLRVIIGEALEHQRFFEQALAGRPDLLGRRADGAGTGGGVLAGRWVERSE